MNKYYINKFIYKIFFVPQKYIFIYYTTAYINTRVFRVVCGHCRQITNIKSPSIRSPDTKGNRVQSRLQQSSSRPSMLHPASQRGLMHGPQRAHAVSLCLFVEAIRRLSRGDLGGEKE